MPCRIKEKLSSMKEQIRLSIKQRISSVKGRIKRNKAVIIFYILIFSVLVLSPFFGEGEKNIPAQNAFCSPDQFLVFLTIAGIILGVFIAKAETITKKLGSRIVYLTGLIIFFSLFFTIVTFITIFFIVFGIIILAGIWIAIKKEKSGEKYFIGALLVFIAYVIVGATGNACFYGITGIEEKLEIPYNTHYPIHGVPGASHEFPAVPCSIDTIQVIKDPYLKPERNYAIAVLIYSSENMTSPYEIEYLREGEQLTLCCFRWKFIEEKQHVSVWKPYNMYDIFCGIQNIFYTKGVYRTT